MKERKQRGREKRMPKGSKGGNGEIFERGRAAEKETGREVKGRKGLVKKGCKEERKGRGVRREMEEEEREALTERRGEGKGQGREGY